MSNDKLSGNHNIITFNDDLCDRCRVNPKNFPFILCKKCTDEWIKYGLYLNSINIISNDAIFDVWFEKTRKKKTGFVFR